MPDGDLAQVPVVDVDDTVPGNGLWIDVEARETVDLFGSEVIRVCLVDAELLEALEHERSELALPLLRRDETAIKRLVGLGNLMEHTSVQSSG